MKQKVHGSRSRKISRPIDASLLKRIAELRNLREKIRLAEVAMRPKHNASQVGRL
jgi:hypothetical protein